MSRAFASILVALATSGLSARQGPVFRAGADAVFVDVSVMDGRHPVEGLTANDFELRDNGVLQHIDGVEPEADSLDVSVILDVSGSVAGPLENRLVKGAREIHDVLHPDDRTEPIIVDRQIRRTAEFSDWRLEVPPRIADGGTRLFDAILTATLEREAPGRRHVVVALTDGLDTESLINRATRRAVLSRSNVVVHLVAISVLGRPSGFSTGRANSKEMNVEVEGDYDYLLREITDATGGKFYDLRLGGSFIGGLKDELDRLRRYYTLRYRPVGVPGPGWHTLAVRLTRSHHDLHARSGYFGK